MIRFSTRRDVRAHLDIIKAIAAGADLAGVALFEQRMIADELRLARNRQFNISQAVQATNMREEIESQVAWCLAYDARKGSKGSGGGHEGNKKQAGAMRRKVARYDIAHRH